MNDPSTYLSQLNDVANGIAAAAFAQNLTFTLSVFSTDAFRQAVVAAKLKWIILPLAAAILFYVLILFACHLAEMSLGPPVPGWIPGLLLAGRVFVVIASAIPFGLAVLEVRRAARVASSAQSGS